MVERFEKPTGRSAPQFEKVEVRKGFDLGAMNSDCGEMWVKRWCHNCYRGENKCRILMRALFNGQQPELVYDENGLGMCTRYKYKGDHVVKHRVNKHQIEIEF